MDNQFNNQPEDSNEIPSQEPVSEQAPQQPQYQQAPQQPYGQMPPQYPYGQVPPQQQYYPPQPTKTSGKAIASFVLSLVGILVAGLICGIIGVCLSVAATNEMKSNPFIKGKGLATAGLVISIIDIIIMVLYFMI